MKYGTIQLPICTRQFPIILERCLKELYVRSSNRQELRSIRLRAGLSGQAQGQGVSPGGRGVSQGWGFFEGDVAVRAEQVRH